jgi:hypothetical protein
MPNTHKSSIPQLAEQLKSNNVHNQEVKLLTLVLKKYLPLIEQTHGSEFDLLYSLGSKLQMVSNIIISYRLLKQALPEVMQNLVKYLQPIYQQYGKDLSGSMMLKIQVQLEGKIKAFDFSGIASVYREAGQEVAAELNPFDPEKALNILRQINSDMGGILYWDSFKLMISQWREIYQNTVIEFLESYVEDWREDSSTLRQVEATQTISQQVYDALASDIEGYAQALVNSEEYQELVEADHARYFKEKMTSYIEAKLQTNSLPEAVKRVIILDLYILASTYYKEAQMQLALTLLDQKANQTAMQQSPLLSQSFFKASASQEQSEQTGLAQKQELKFQKYN